jgi:hypothetical protein
VHITTARRWVREQNAPRAVILLLSRNLGILDPEWDGWTINKGSLRSPEGIEITVAEALSHPFMRVQIAALQSDVRKLRELPGIDEQPEPGEWLNEISQLVG